MVVFVIGVASWFAEGLALHECPGWASSGRSGVQVWAAQCRARSSWRSATGCSATGACRPRRRRSGCRSTGSPTQASKLILPAIATLFLTLTGTIPTWGYLVAVLISLPVALGSLVSIWVLRSEAFALRVGAFATRATDAVMRRINRPEPEDLTPRLMGFRESARVDAPRADRPDGAEPGPRPVDGLRPAARVTAGGRRPGRDPAAGHRPRRATRP